MHGVIQDSFTEGWGTKFYVCKTPPSIMLHSIGFNTIFSLKLEKVGKVVLQPRNSHTERLSGQLHNVSLCCIWYGLQGADNYITRQMQDIVEQVYTLALVLHF